MALAELFDLYRNDLNGRPSHITYGSALTTIQRFYAETDRQEFAVEDLSRFRAWMDDQDYSKATRASYLSTLRGFLKWLVLHGHIEGELHSKMLLHYDLGKGGSYTGFVRRQIEPSDVQMVLFAFGMAREIPKDRPETPKERIARLAYMRDRAIVYLLAGTGLRVSELLSLTRKPFDEFFGNWDGKQSMIVSVVGKRDKPRDVVATARYLQRVKEYLLDRGDDSPEMVRFLRDKGLEPPLFISHNGRHTSNYRLARQSAWRSIAGTAKSLGIESFVSPHAFRHYCLQKLADHDMGLRDLADLAGHADVRITHQAYLKSTQARKLAAKVEEAQAEKT